MTGSNNPRTSLRTSFVPVRSWLRAAVGVTLLAALPAVAAPVPAFASPAATPTSCTPSDTVLCLLGGRFEVSVAWQTFFGTSGPGIARPVTDHTGSFWFFDPSSLELMVKVVDGRQENGHFWVFYGSLTNVAFEVRVTDTVTHEAQRYFNPLGLFSGVGDTQAFAADAGNRPTQSPAAGVPTTPGTACGDGTDLCLLEDRFRLEVRWTDPQGHTRTAHPVSLSGDTGAFWFERPADLEMIVRMLDARPLNGSFWVFLGPLSQRRFEVRVTDTETGDIKTYVNPAGLFFSLADTSAFPGTP